MTVSERLAALREIMSEKNIDAYLIPTDDFHGSESVGEYFKCRKYISGFTGSAGTVIVTKDKAGLWTDGRYFLQADIQLEGSGIELYKMGEPGVPTIEEFAACEIPENGVLGFDGRTLVMNGAEKLENALCAKNIKLSYSDDLVGMIWKDRPSLPDDKAWLLPLEFAGESRESKLKRVRKAIADNGANALVLTSLDDLAWLLNYRGNDIDGSPVVLAYAYIDERTVILFCDEDKFAAADKDELASAGVVFRPYNDIYEFVKNLEIPDWFKESEDANSNHKKWIVMIDDEKVNYTIAGNMNVNNNIEVLCEENPTAVMKAVKNKTEIELTRATHIKDGIALTKLIYWLKHRNVDEQITEIDVSEKLETFRHEQEGYLFPCFGTLSAYGEHAAIIHYWPTAETNAVLGDKGFILIDCGSTFMGGSTDVTRTISLGALTEQEKVHYTAVLKGHLNLGHARFPEGMRGVNLDAIARKPIWDVGCDYKHGTGHGIGYMLNCHEGPNCIRNAFAPARANRGIIEENMITSNEPGIYIAGSHGIRIETLILAVKDDSNADVPMMKFETLTLVPYDREAIISENLTSSEIAQLNAYHKRVYDTIGPHLTEAERAWLREATKEI